jgi:hypothetical protein
MVARMLSRSSSLKAGGVYIGVLRGAPEIILVWPD